MSFSNVSPQAKVFKVTHVVAMLAELVGEISLYNLVPTQNAAMRTRFWAQYVIGAAISAILGVMGFLATDCLAKNGWKKLAWGFCVLPSIAATTGGFVLHGVDSILGSSSGTGSVALIRAAYASKKKKSAK